MERDLVVLGRPGDRSLRFLALRAPLGIRTGDIATPVVMTNDAAVAETVVPRTLEDEDEAPQPQRADSRAIDGARYSRTSVSTAHIS